MIIAAKMIRKIATYSTVAVLILTQPTFNNLYSNVNHTQIGESRNVFIELVRSTIIWAVTLNQI